MGAGEAPPGFDIAYEGAKLGGRRQGQVVQETATYPLLVIAISQSSFLSSWKYEIEPVMVSDYNPGDIPETDDLPKVDTTSEEYAIGFDAGIEGKPCDGETREWRRGWADARQ